MLCVELEPLAQGRTVCCGGGLAPNMGKWRSEITPLAAEGWLPKAQSGGLCMPLHGTALVLLMSQHCIAFLGSVQQSSIVLWLYSFPPNGHVQFCL